jgi:hypothetical protein
MGRPGRGSGVDGIPHGDKAMSMGEARHSKHRRPGAEQRARRRHPLVPVGAIVLQLGEAFDDGGGLLS